LKKWEKNFNSDWKKKLKITETTSCFAILIYGSIINYPKWLLILRTLLRVNFHCFWDSIFRLRFFLFCINNCAHRHCRKYRCCFSFTTMRRIIMRSWLYSGSIDICDIVRIQSEPIDLRETYHVDEKKTTRMHSRATQLRGVSRINTREGRLTSFWYRYHHNPIMDNYDHYDSKDSIPIAKRKSSAGWRWTFNSLNSHSEKSRVFQIIITHIYMAVSNIFAGGREYRCVGIILRDGSSSSQARRILQQRDSQHAGDRGSRSMPGSKHRYFRGDPALRPQ